MNKQTWCIIKWVYVFWHTSLFVNCMIYLIYISPLHMALGVLSCIWWNNQKLIPFYNIWFDYLFAPIQVVKSFSSHSSLIFPKRSIRVSLFSSPHSFMIMGFNTGQFSKIPSTVRPSATLHKSYNISELIRSPYSIPVTWKVDAILRLQWWQLHDSHSFIHQIVA